MDSPSNEHPTAAPSEAKEENEHIIQATKSLRRHMGLPEDPTEKSSSATASSVKQTFWVEVAPPSTRGAKCRLDGCPANIMPGQYRIAVYPGFHDFRGHQSSDFYHVVCFEKIADFSQADFVDQVEPVTRNTWSFRNLNSSSVLDGNYLLDAGAERLTISWKEAVKKLIDERDGVETKDDWSAAVRDLLDNAGSSKYVTQEIPDANAFQLRLLRSRLAPNESDGPDDTEEWNLFDEYLAPRDDDQKSLEDRHTLGATLFLWRDHVVLATSNNPTEKDKKRIEQELTPKAIRAIKRLAVTPMPDIQGAFLRGL
ncbi:hypothetical protein V501_02401 [Pseudogymnoascus sp. VKM F-4519 (FW-2642)]|nr:hypothetical protein V501_02401 [Pseudogymnoascus sp. VKM F-4519 (FW-2642)]